MITFHNARDEYGRVVHIDEVTKNNRFKRYYCISCGNEMCAVLGDKREHHFRHKEAHCSWESYLHKLGKLRLKEKFYLQGELKIKYNVEYLCKKSEECKLHAIYGSCYSRGLIEYDLKKLYDTCEEEVVYKGYRADLMLSSREHPEREPIFLEISVTHDCEPKKIESGIKIIELKITNEKDALCPLIEGMSIRFYNFGRMLPMSRPLGIFYVIKDNTGLLRGYLIKDGLNCINVAHYHNDNAIYKLVIPTEVSIRGCVPNMFEYGMMKAVAAGFDVRHCAMCFYYKYCRIKVMEKGVAGERIVTRYVKREKGLDKVEIAYSCKKYSLNRAYWQQVLCKYRPLPCREWRKEF